MLENIKKILAGKCEHPIDSRAIVEGGREQVCLECGEDLGEISIIFRKYIRLNKHISKSIGWPTNAEGKYLTNDPTFNVGLRFVVPGNPDAIRRVWLTFTDKKSQKVFAAQLDRRLRVCGTDEAYNEVINEALEQIRIANPDVPEEVVERGEMDGDIEA